MSMKRPAPIRTDASNPFAHDTMIRRVPATIQDIMDRNPDYSETICRALENLSRSIQHNERIALLSSFAPDFTDWQPAFETRQNETWLNTEWFFAETYFYRQVIECIRWWETGRDPFTPNKIEEYQSRALMQLVEVALMDTRPAAVRLGESIARALWGNRIDLSFAASREHGTQANAEDLIADDNASTVAQLLNGNGAVHFINDNAGSELAMDLALVDTLLDGIADEVVLHLKMHPTFVSDALAKDVWMFLDILMERGGNFAVFADRLRSAIHAGRLRLMPNLFWNSSHFLWDAPAHLLNGFKGARLVIVKGDANYRRIVGDALWPADTPFADVMAYFPAPLLALRTLKSDPIVGLPSGMAQQLDTVDKNWRVNGRRGVIQFKG